VPLNKVAIDGPLWAPRQQVNREVTLPIEYEQCERTGRIAAWKLDWKPGQPNPPHHFWDSDVAKWIEAAGYSLATHPDEELEQLVDGVIDVIAEAQQEDGYLNIHFTVVEPENRWKNLRDMHELYCAGHLMEAAVAYYEGTGKRRLLDVLCRYAETIDSVFGPDEGQKRGYPGHEEIELALVKLYRVTGEERYLDLAKFFVDERGRRPPYYDVEARARGEDSQNFHGRGYDYNQSHAPVREQDTAEGHAVRAMYLYSGMADVAAETGDESLVAACERLWRNVTQRRMYVSGGIGSSSCGERFTYDYDLPNDVAYAETCAAIGLVFWAHRMLQFDGDRVYADVMERALYNGVLSGVSLDGRTFFYANPLEVDPEKHARRPDLFRGPSVSPTRQGWFRCACCPPNIARLLASLGQYVYSQSGREAYVHLYVGGRAELELDGQSVTLTQETHYPWEGEVQVTVHPEREASFVLALRIPGWSRGASLEVNGQPLEVGASAAVKGGASPAEGAVPLTERGYARIDRIWRPGDTVRLSLPMPVERIWAHPAVKENCGRVALQRGPLVYCLEEIDNGPHLHSIALPRDAALKAEFDEDLLGGVVVIRGEAERQDTSEWEGTLYRPVRPATKAVPLKAVPYYAWANRAPGEMLVWIRER
jgi:hypothetical protein